MPGKLEKPICYHGGSSFKAIGYDLSNFKGRNSVIRADVTDAWYDPAPEVSKALEKDINWLLKNSPPTYSEGLVKTISRVRGIPKGCIVAGNGSSALMFLLFPAILSKGDSVLILDPMYGEYRHIFRNVLGIPVKLVAQDTKDGFRIRPEKILASIGKNTRLVAIVNPNSPTSQYLTKKQILALLQKLPKRTTLFIDETYIDYMGSSQSMETLVKKYGNLIVLKSMSKYYALSGARVGYLAVNPALARRLNVRNPPWSVNLLGQVAGMAALRHENYYKRMASETKEIGKMLYLALRKMRGLKPYPPTANFILVELVATRLSAQKICDRLAQQKIFIRNTDSQSPQFKNNFLRISIKSRAQTKRIISELRKALAP